MRRSIATRRWKHREEGENIWSFVLLNPLTFFILILMAVIALLGYLSS